MSFVPGQLTHAEGLDYGPITVSGGGSCPLWSAGNYFVELYASFSPPVPPSLPVPRGSDSTARQRLMAASSFIATLATIVIAPTLPFACTLSSACVLLFSSFLLTRPILIFDWKGRSPTPPSPPPSPSPSPRALSRRSTALRHAPARMLPRKQLPWHSSHFHRLLPLAPKKPVEIRYRTDSSCACESQSRRTAQQAPVMHAPAAYRRIKTVWRCAGWVIGPNVLNHTALPILTCGIRPPEMHYSPTRRCQVYHVLLAAANTRAVGRCYGYGVLSACCCRL